MFFVNGEPWNVLVDQLVADCFEFFEGEHSVHEFEIIIHVLVLCDMQIIIPFELK